MDGLFVPTQEALWSGARLAVSYSSSGLERRTLSFQPLNPEVPFSHNHQFQTYERTTFAVMPEIGVKLGYKVTNHLQVFASATD